MKKSLYISCPASSRSGYGDHSRDIIKSLISMDKFDIKILDQRWGWCPRTALQDEPELAELVIPLGTPLTEQPDVWIQVTVPNEFKPVGKFNIGIMFGREKSGLTNNQVSYANTIVQIPTNKKFSSLNLAQSVAIIASEINRINEDYGKSEIFTSDSIPAKKKEIISFFNHLERALDASGFLRPKEKKSTMMINLRNIFSRTDLTNQDVQTLRGVITSLLRWPEGYKDKEILKKTKIIADGYDKNKQQRN